MATDIVTTATIATPLTFRQLLNDLHACPDSQQWVFTQDFEGASLSEMWHSCPNGYWLVWLVAALPIPRTHLVDIALRYTAPLLKNEYFVAEGGEKLYRATEAWLNGSGDVSGMHHANTLTKRTYQSVIDLLCIPIRVIQFDKPTIAANVVNDLFSNAAFFIRPYYAGNVLGNRKILAKIARECVPFSLVLDAVQTTYNSGTSRRIFHQMEDMI